MRVVRVGTLPKNSVQAAAEFYARIVAELNPPRDGEGDHPQGGGGGSPQTPRLEEASLHRTSSGPPPHTGEDLTIVFDPAPYDHRGWRLAVVQDLARAAAPARVNAVAGDDDAAIAEALAYLEAAHGVTGQLLAV